MATAPTNPPIKPARTVSATDDCAPNWASCPALPYLTDIAASSYETCHGLMFKTFKTWLHNREAGDQARLLLNDCGIVSRHRPILPTCLAPSRPMVIRRRTRPDRRVCPSGIWPLWDKRRSGE